jgi:putative PIN family toxin of toxin-antitoxin system
LNRFCLIIPLFYDSTRAIIKSMVERVVVDTSVLVSAMIGGQGASRAVIRLCLRRRCQPIVGEKLFSEYEAVLGREELFRRSPLTRSERDELLDAFLHVCEWTPVYYLWRPNLPDEADNHLVELAVAGTASTIVTQNVRDLRRGELLFPQLTAETASEFMTRWRKNYGNDDN